MISHLTELCSMIWAEQSVPQHFRDAIIVHIYKRKGHRTLTRRLRSCCLVRADFGLLYEVSLRRQLGDDRNLQAVQFP